MTTGARWALALAVASLFAAAATRFPPNDTDVFWHLATARWMTEHGALARVDTFSSTAVGAWLPQQQWLGQLALHAAFVLGSWWGIVVLRGLVVLLVAALVVERALAASPRPWVGALAAAPGLALSRIVWADRPELLGLACFAAFLALALRAREGSRLALVALTPLLGLWANVHGSFVVGAALLAALSLEVALRERQRRREFLAFATLALLATLANPDGVRVYEGPGWHFTSPPRFLEEWQLPDVATFAGALYAATLLGTFAAALLASGSPSWLALLVPLAFLSLTAVRHTPLFALAAAPYLASALPVALARLGARIAPASRRSPIALPALGFATVLLAAAFASAPRDADLRGFPVRALDALRGERGVLFNEYDWGGFLMWALPDRGVFIDGRLGIYVGAVLDDYVAAISLQPTFREVLDRHQVSLVLLRPERPLATRLRLEGWRVLVADTDLVLLKRPR